MKKFSLFLISVTLFLGMIKLFKKTKDNLQLFTQREQEILNEIAVGYKDNEIAGLLHTSEKSIQQCESNSKWHSICLHTIRKYKPIKPNHEQLWDGKPRVLRFQDSWVVEVVR